MNRCVAIVGGLCELLGNSQISRAYAKGDWYHGSLNNKKKTKFSMHVPTANSKHTWTIDVGLKSPTFNEHNYGVSLAVVIHRTPTFLTLAVPAGTLSL